MLTIKAKLGEDLRRFQFSGVSWDNLLQELLTRFQLSTSVSLEVRYLDAENDVITISSDSELKEALHCTISQGSSTLKLDLTIAPRSAASPSSSAAVPAIAAIPAVVAVESTCSDNEIMSPEPVTSPVVPVSTPVATPVATATPAVIPLVAEPVEELEPVVAQQVSPSAEPEPKPEPEPTPEAKKEEAVEEEVKDPKSQAGEEEVVVVAEVPQKPRHVGVVCDVCRRDIVGVRYKCGHCPDFDACETCEATDFSHPPNHLFIKIKTPLAQAAWAYKSILLPPVTVVAKRIPPAFCHLDLTPTPAATSSSSSSLPVLLEPLAALVNYTPASAPVSIPTPVQPTPTTIQPAPTAIPSLASPSPSSPAPSSTTTTTPSSSSPSPSVDPKFDAKFVEDLSIMDGTILSKATTFTKTWKLKNTGSSKWPVGTRLAFVGGDAMGKLQSVVVAAAIPNQEVDISVALTSPAEPGRYVSHWRLQTPDGHKFGHRVWCDISVARDATPSPVPEAQATHVPPTPSTTAVLSSSPPRESLIPAGDERYDEEMKHLLQMGFGDRTKNLRLLKKHKGDIQGTLEALLADAQQGWTS